MGCIRVRYLKYLRLSLVKKRAVGEWKQEQLSARRQQQHGVLAADVLHPDEAAAADQSLNTSGMQDSNGEKKAPGSSEKDRAAVKERIAKWRAAQAKQLEDEKVTREIAMKMHMHVVACECLYGGVLITHPPYV